MTKEEYKKAIEERRIIIIGSKLTSNGWTQFRVYEVRDNQLLHIDVESAYWSKKDHVYKCVVWGTSRPLEIFLSIGYHLGLKFEEMSPQVSSIIN